MKRARESVPPDIGSLILEIGSQKVILDADLANLYGVPTKALNQAVKRNRERFPSDFLFKAIVEEIAELNRSQGVTRFHLKENAVPYRINREAGGAGIGKGATE